MTDADERIKDALYGCLLGAAIGDALGLPMEGLSKERQARMYKNIDGYRMPGRRGLVSDDTEHACMTACALAESGGDENMFAKALGRSLRNWFLCLPPGIGFATLRSLLKLLAGFSPTKSGVFSAGNGPAMRSPIIGARYGGNTDKMKRLVRISARVTHTDPKAEYGALAVALAAYKSSIGENDPDEFLGDLQAMLPADAGELTTLAASAVESAKRGETTEAFAAGMGLGSGVSGYMYHTAPVALHAWMRNPVDLPGAVQSAIRCGGDTDTTGAIVGGIVGAGINAESLPPHLITNLAGWPVTIAFMKKAADALSRNIGAEPDSASFPAGEDAPTDATSATLPTQRIKFPFIKLFARNLIVIPLILLLGFRRLFPPY